MKTITLIRHGQSLGNINSTYYVTTPDWKIPLSDTGRSQAEDVGKKLAIHLQSTSAALYFSPMYRAKETFELMKSSIISNLSSIREEPLVSEQSFGMPNSYTNEFGNIEMMEVRESYGSFYYCPPDGESTLDVLMRGKRFLDEIEKRGHDNTVVVTHGSFMKVILMELLGWDVEYFDRVKRPDNCQIIHLQGEFLGSWHCSEEMKFRKRKIKDHGDYA